MSHYSITQICHLFFLPPNLRGKISTNSQIILGTLDENKNSKVHTIKILSDSGASALIVRKDVLYERHRILKDKKNKWSTMAVTVNTTFVTENIKTSGTKSFRENLREMLFDGQIIKLQFNLRMGCAT